MKLTKTLALLIFCIFSVNVRAIENLHGLVRSVETTSAQGTENISTKSPSELEIYDPDGFLIEQYRYGVTIRQEYDVHGTLRSKLQSGPEGSTFRQSEHDGSVGNSQTVIVKYKYDPRHWSNYKHYY